MLAFLSNYIYILITKLSHSSAPSELPAQKTVGINKVICNVFFGAWAIFVSIVVARLMIFWNTICIHKIPNYDGSTCKSVYCDAKKCLNFLLHILALLMNLSSF